MYIQACMHIHRHAYMHTCLWEKHMNTDSHGVFPEHNIQKPHRSFNKCHPGHVAFPQTYSHYTLPRPMDAWM